MIASPSIAFNDFSGSANDVTARQTKGRTMLTVKPRPTGACAYLAITIFPLRE